VKCLDGKALLECCVSGFSLVSMHQIELNNLNVFPVPDGDTGLNMSRTLAPVASLCPKENISEMAESIAESVLRASRGNSGTILATFFLGFSSYLKGLKEATPSDLVAAFIKGTKESYHSIAEPTEGTILTVMTSACSITPKKDIEATLKALVEAANEAEKNTPELLPLLKRSGVVDSGGLGFCYLLAGFLKAVRGESVEHLDSGDGASINDFDHESDLHYRFCVEGIIAKSKSYQAPNNALTFKEMLNEMGGSEVFLETNNLVKFHVHTNDDELVRNTAMRFGTLLDFKSDNMQKQVEERLKDGSIALVPIISSAEFAAIYTNYGVKNLVLNHMDGEVSYNDILSTLEQVESELIILLPNNENHFSTCELIAKRHNKRIAYISTRNEAEGIVALDKFDSEAPFEINTQKMSHAVNNAVSFAIAKAQKPYKKRNLSISIGDWVLFDRGEPVAKASLLNELVSPLSSLLASKDTINLYYGVEISEEEARGFTNDLEAKVDSLSDVILANGGETIYAFLITGETN